mgnify:CR=1 FL=1
MKSALAAFTTTQVHLRPLAARQCSAGSPNDACNESGSRGFLPYGVMQQLALAADEQRTRLSLFNSGLAEFALASAAMNLPSSSRQLDAAVRPSCAGNS